MTEMHQFDTPEHADHVAQTEANMIASGIPTTQVENPFAGFGDYWDEPEPIRWYFPDGKQYIEFLPMTEGARRKYQSKTATKMTMHRATDTQSITYNPATDRQALLEHSVVDWYVLKDGKPVAFGNANYGFNAWVSKANPKYIEALEKEIRKANTWMDSELDLEEIDKQIEELKEKRERVLERQAGEGSSSSK
ncbi:tail assembly chaperone [Rhodococcus phage Reynauld]|uniref:Tail assembly chaperone n=1 Tax=Rhodococcus phage Reynauld TaxID=3062845 RepID=A0ACD4UJL1_9CAUD|nr:tail assembly chaperone [Rhodococcus phage Reynauld]